MPFDLIHMDLKTLPILSYHKYKYILTFLDDHTSHGWISLLKNESDMTKAIDRFIVMVSTQYKSRVQAVMSDFGEEFTSLRRGLYCAPRIRQVRTPSYSVVLRTDSQISNLADITLQK